MAVYSSDYQQNQYVSKLYNKKLKLVILLNLVHAGYLQFMVMNMAFCLKLVKHQ